MSTSTKLIIAALLLAVVGFILYKRKASKKDMNGPLEVKRFEVNKSDDGSVITGAVDVVRNYGNGLSSMNRVALDDFNSSSDWA